MRRSSSRRLSVLQQQLRPCAVAAQEEKTVADLIENRFGLPTEDGRYMPAEHYGEIASILSHRSHRKFTDQPVSDEILRIALAGAFSAPAKSDLQQCTVIVLKDPAVKAKMRELTKDWVPDAPAFIVFCGDNRRIRRVSEARGKPYKNGDRLDAFLNCAGDAAITLATFIRSAQALGLGCCPVSTIRNKINEWADLLQLPDHVFPFAGMGVGWPATEGFVSLRLPPSITVHTDRYDDTNMLEEMDGYDGRRDARFSVPPERQMMQQEYGIASFYGWSEQKARQESTVSVDGATLGPYLRARGFGLE